MSVKGIDFCPKSSVWVLLPLAVPCLNLSPQSLLLQRGRRWSPLLLHHTENDQKMNKKLRNCVKMRGQSTWTSTTQVISWCGRRTGNKTSLGLEPFRWFHYGGQRKKMDLCRKDRPKSVINLFSIWWVSYFSSFVSCCFKENKGFLFLFCKAVLFNRWRMT